MADLRREPLRSIYETMTEVLEEAGATQERGDIKATVSLAEQASILGRAIEILAARDAVKATANI